MLELMVVVAIIGIGLTLAVPYFGNATRAAKERSVVAKLLQDFDWARGAAGAGDASTLGVTGASGAPVITMTLNASANNCSWLTVVNGQNDLAHSMSYSQLTAIAPGINCSSGTLLKGAQFAFNANGTVSPSGTFTYTGSGTTSWPLQFLFSGTVIRTTGAS